MSAVRQVSRQEGKELFDTDAQRLLGISGDEFIRLYKADQLDQFEHADVMELIVSLPFYGPIG